MGIRTRTIIKKFLQVHDKVFLGIFGAVLIFALIVGFIDASRQPLDFDGSYNLQVANNLANKGHFATNDPGDTSKIRLFDTYITTGPVVLVPLAFSFHIFGEGVMQFRIPMLAVYLMVTITLGVIAYRETKSRLAILAPMGFLLLGHVFYRDINYLDLRFDPVGEIPATFLSLLAIYCWLQKKGFLVGLLIGLAILAKIISVFWLVAAVFAIALEIHWKKFDRIFWLRMVAGVTIALSTWELYRFKVLGSLEAYLNNWRETISFLKIAGSGLTETPENITIIQKISALVNGIEAPLIILGSVSIIVSIILLKNINKLPLFFKQYYFPLIFAILYIGWWLLLSDRDYMRHVIPALVVGWLLVCLYLIKYGRQNLLIPAIGLVSIALCGQLFTVLQPYKISLEDQEHIAGVISQNKKAALVHDGWWQNPEISFLAHRHSVDMRIAKGNDPSLLVLSPIMKSIDPTHYYEVKNNCRKVILDQKGYVLCWSSKI